MADIIIKLVLGSLIYFCSTDESYSTDDFKTRYCLAKNSSGSELRGFVLLSMVANGDY